MPCGRGKAWLTENPVSNGLNCPGSRNRCPWPCCKNDVLAKQTAINLRHIISSIVGDANHAWSIHEDVLEALALCYLRIILYHGLGDRIDECRRIYHSDFVRLQVLPVWRMDAAFQNLVQGIAADDGILCKHGCFCDSSSNRLPHLQSQRWSLPPAVCSHCRQSTSVLLPILRKSSSYDSWLNLYSY